MIVQVIMTDGRKECLVQTLDSLASMVTGSITSLLVHDDSGDPEYGNWLRHFFEGRATVISSATRQGFGESIRRTWNLLRAAYKEKFVFWMEDDFVFTRPADLDAACELLMRQPHLAQLAYRRQPWSPEERQEGGFMETRPPGTYYEHSDVIETWVEHTVNWTTNPHLTRRKIMDIGWPPDPHSEGHFGFKLKEQGLPWGVPGSEVRFGFVGTMESGRNWVEHIGVERIGKGY